MSKNSNGAMSQEDGKTQRYIKTLRDACHNGHCLGRKITCDKCYWYNESIRKYGYPVM